MYCTHLSYGLKYPWKDNDNDLLNVLHFIKSKQTAMQMIQTHVNALIEKQYLRQFIGTTIVCKGMSFNCWNSYNKDSVLAAIQN